MTKQEIKQKVNDTNASPLVKEMVLGYVDIAYDSGFEEGMKWGVKTVASINKVLLNSNESDLHANDCPECHVSLNKNGTCPSCEQDHADNVREAGEGK